MNSTKLNVTVTPRELKEHEIAHNEKVLPLVLAEIEDIIRTQLSTQRATKSVKKKISKEINTILNKHKIVYKPVEVEVTRG